jgi:hypoxanthine phosphoribosyltransferase
MINLISETTLKQKIESLSEVLNKDFRGKKDLLGLTVLTGGIWFTGQIMTMLSLEMEFGYIGYRRYNEDQETPNGVYIPSSVPVQNKNVILFDDIYDQGITIEKLKEIILGRGALSVYSVVLLNKKVTTLRSSTPDYSVMDIGPNYVFGSGMDYQGKNRNAPGIWIP